MMIIKPLSLTIILGMLVGTASAQTHMTIQEGISKVEAGLIPPVRFEGETSWDIVSRMQFYNVPGVSIAVIKDSKVIWSKTYGYADLDSKTPVTSKTLFQVASMSKPVSAYAALKAVEEGKLDPDSNVNVYLKSWKVSENEWTKSKKVTLKNIVNHTAGFTVSGFPGYKVSDPLPTAVQVLNGVTPSNTPAVFVDKLPGANFRYSGGGYTVMQQMLSDLEGKDFTTIMREKVLLPLAMHNSSFAQPLPAAQAQFTATAYGVDGRKVEGRYHIYPEQAAAGLWSTAEDYAKFVIDIQNTLSGKSCRVISKKTAEEFTSPFIEPFIGLGIFLENYNGEVYVTHGGWNEGFSSSFIGSKTSGDGVVILTNTNKPLFINELVRSVALVYHWPNYIAATNQILPLSQQDLNAHLGSYKFEKYGFIKVYKENGKLMTVRNVDAPVELIKVGENKFAMRDWNFKVSFDMDSSSGKKELVQTLADKTVRSKSPQIGSDETVPLALILEGHFEKGVKAYQKAKQEDSQHEQLSEGFLNGTGYELLHQKKNAQAIAFFSINTILYPESENVYDSLAEAYLKDGQKEKAKQNYLKVLEINTKNEKARKILETL
ncbi:serine hydrolase [Sphingobacterium kitahiroshimense]|uniref:serine hydrolase n=1 Tax=Sphingobacterium kitahiroshimense TaxID=470446 RepID=UPI003209864D